jgi:hypothetical protein
MPCLLRHSQLDLSQNLGNGFAKLVESNLLLKSGVAGVFEGYATKQAASYARMAIVDKATGRYLVDIYLSGEVPVANSKIPTSPLGSRLEVTQPSYSGAVS